MQEQGIDGDLVEVSGCEGLWSFCSDQTDVRSGRDAVCEVRREEMLL